MLLTIRHRAFIVLVAVAGVLSVFAATRASASPSSSPAPVLWNTFQGPWAITHSKVGPPLGFYKNSDCASNPACLGAGIDVKANPGFVPGYRGKGLTIAPGSYRSEQREHNVVLRNLGQVLNIEHGTISEWFRQNAVPVAYQYGIYRIFDGAFGLGSAIGIFVGADDRIQFGINGPAGVVSALSVADGQPGAYIGGTKSWLHLVAVWDRAGITGSADRLRLYINGALVATSTDGSWGTQMGNIADIGGGNDARIANKFVVDRLMLFGSAVLPAGISQP